MTTEYYIAEILSTLNKGLGADELRIRLAEIVNEIRNEERTKHLAEGVKQYKRIDEQSPVIQMPNRDGTSEGNIPTIVALTNEARFDDPQKIGES